MVSVTSKPEKPQTLTKRRRKLIKKYGKALTRKLSGFLSRQSIVEDRPFVSNDHFPFLKDFEANWQKIEAEAREILKHRESIPGFQEISPDQYRISTGKNWRTFILYGFGTLLAKNAAQAPETMKLLFQIPNLQTAWFSILAPGYHIPAHRGVTKGILRAHLGLIIPKEYEKCRIRVGDEIQAWEAGKIFVLDDTYEHEVWNDTDEERVILLFDFDRPMRFWGRFVNKSFLMLMKFTAFYQQPKKNLQTAEDQFEAAVRQANENLEKMSEPSEN